MPTCAHCHIPLSVDPLDAATPTLCPQCESHELKRRAAIDFLRCNKIYRGDVHHQHIYTPTPNFIGDFSWTTQHSPTPHNVRKC